MSLGVNDEQIFKKYNMEKSGEINENKILKANLLMVMIIYT